MSLLLAHCVFIHKLVVKTDESTLAKWLGFNSNIVCTPEPWRKLLCLARKLMAFPKPSKVYFPLYWRNVLKQAIKSSGRLGSYLTILKVSYLPSALIRYFVIQSKKNCNAFRLFCLFRYLMDALAFM